MLTFLTKEASKLYLWRTIMQHLELGILHEYKDKFNFFIILFYIRSKIIKMSD